MAEKESGAASAATETTPMTKNHNREGFDQTDNVPQKVEVVKSEWSRAAQLQWLFLHCGTSRELVEEIQKIYPKFDKTVLCKAKNPDAYGVEICDKALKHLWKTYAPEEYAKRKRHSDGHRLTKRLHCRLDDETYESFIGRSREDGYKDTNECLTALIKDYLSQNHKKEKASCL